MPIVEGGGGGSCEVITTNVNAINPLNLSRRPLSNKQMMAEPLIDDPTLMKHPSNRFAFSHKQKELSYEKQMNESATLNRFKRDRSMIIRADKLVDSDGKKTNIVTMVN